MGAFVPTTIKEPVICLFPLIDCLLHFDTDSQIFDHPQFCPSVWHCGTNGNVLWLLFSFSFLFHIFYFFCINYKTRSNSMFAAVFGNLDKTTWHSIDTEVPLSSMRRGKRKRKKKNLCPAASRVTCFFFKMRLKYSRNWKEGKVKDRKRFSLFFFFF